MIQVVANGIKTATSSKGYMTGFSGFAAVIGKIRTKLKRETLEIKKSCLAVDVNYDQPIIFQIEETLIGVINRTQGPIRRLMETFGLTDFSHYCEPLNKISDIHKSFQKLSTSRQSLNLHLQYKTTKKTLTKRKQFNGWLTLRWNLTICQLKQIQTMEKK